LERIIRAACGLTTTEIMLISSTRDLAAKSDM